MNIYIWQRIVTPHMTGLAQALAHMGVRVTYVAEQFTSPDRVQQGWPVPALQNVALHIMSTPDDARLIASAAPSDSIHICQGIRSNGRIRYAQLELAKRGLKQWVVMETVDDVGMLGVLKRIEYRRLFSCWYKSLEGVLATGYSTPVWVVERGMPSSSVFPFAYFLSQVKSNIVTGSRNNGTRYRFLFVGQFIERKCLDVLIRALGSLHDGRIELAIVGDGPLEASLRTLAVNTLPGQVDWMGCLPMAAVPSAMERADCLVLPSRHDGWGAVISEALMVGTPVLCSDRCGAAGVVKAAGYGGIFRSGDIEGLTAQLRRLVLQGPLPAQVRGALANWALCLNEAAGARYLIRILEFKAGQGSRPVAPWEGAY